MAIQLQPQARLGYRLPLAPAHPAPYPVHYTSYPRATPIRRGTSRPGRLSTAQGLGGLGDAASTGREIGVMGTAGASVATGVAGMLAANGVLGLTAAAVPVIGAALMCKGMWAMLNLAGVYSPKQSLTFNVYLPPVRYAMVEKQADLYKASLEKLGALPGVTHAAITTSLPNGNDKWMDDFRIENRPVVPGKFQSAQRIAVSSDYFAAVHIPILSGRSFNSGDGLDTQRVAIISRKFAERYFPGEDPIGHRISMGRSSANEEPWARVVGISGDANYSWIDRETLPGARVRASGSRRRAWRRRRAAKSAPA